MSQDATTRHAALVGLFVSAGFMIFVAALFALGTLAEGLTSRTTVTASFGNVSGLKAGDSVWFSGVKVGLVKDVSLGTGSLVDVEMAVDSAAAERIPTDVLATLSSDGLIGNRIVVLDGGTPASAGLEEGQAVKAGKSLSAEQLMAEFQQTNNKLQSVATHLEVVTERIASGEGSVGRMLADDELYDRINGTVADLEGAARNADVLTLNAAVFSENLNTAGQLPHDLVTDSTTHASITRSVETLEGAADDAAQMVAEMRASAANPDTPMGVLLHDQEAGSDLGATLDNLNTSTELLAEDLEALQSNFLLRGFFKKKEKREAKEAEESLVVRPDDED